MKLTLILATLFAAAAPANADWCGIDGTLCWPTPQCIAEPQHCGMTRREVCREWRRGRIEFGPRHSAAAPQCNAR